MLSGKHIRAVGFDVYGVMTPSPFVEMENRAQAAGVPAGFISAAFSTPRWLDDVQRGSVSTEDYISEVVGSLRTSHGADLSEDVITQCLSRSLVAVPAMVDLVRDVRRSCLVGLLTNNIRESPLWAPVLNDDLFDVIVDASCGVRKPEPGAFAALVDAFGVGAAEVAFIDDSASNLRSARALGLHTILFTGTAQCREELTRMDISLAAVTGR
jgi:putative hydrolase of the HAD superfamily